MIWVLKSEISKKDLPCKNIECLRSTYEWKASGEFLINHIFLAIFPIHRLGMI